MKRQILVLLVVASLVGCSSNDLEEGINCLFESAHFGVDHAIDEADSNRVTLTLEYSGDLTLDNQVHWDFGDGQTETLTGKTAAHTYANAGNYTITVRPTVRSGDSFCTPELKENVIIE